MKSKILAILEILLVYVAIQIIGILRRSTGMVQWEVQNLGWSYTGMLVFIGIPALLIWLTRRKWSDYGVSLANWRTNLDLGIKAYLVRFIPLLLGLGGATMIGLDNLKITGGAFVALFELIGLAVMIWVIIRQKPVKSGRNNLITILLLLLFPILVALAVGKLTVLVVSTVIWQFIFSGFGEEFVWRGYVQSRLNQAFERPYQLFGIQFGPGLIITSLLFGLLHAFNTYDPAIGFASLSWGWALWTFVAALTFGVLREKTGTLVAPGITHGLPDAVGEGLNVIFGWM
ncbi:MAG TPA: CPBP family intramembrane glutamic endopeptidase [Anaerolineales bacterium]|nr:CPBP family intramembrane glutamic endopeptidase [Anaerolineales bacterium]